MPIPYQIPNEGPTGALLTAMGRHSWRPDHVHYKISAPGMHTHISQAYFEGGAYVEADCCEDVCEEHVVAEKVEAGVRIVEWVLDRMSVVSGKSVSVSVNLGGSRMIKKKISR